MHNVTYQIWCQAEIAPQMLRLRENPHATVVFAPQTMEVGFTELFWKAQVTARNSAISVLFRITIGAKFPSQMNPLSQSDVSGIPSRGNPLAAYAKTQQSRRPAGACWVSVFKSKIASSEISLRDVASAPHKGPFAPVSCQGTPCSAAEGASGTSALRLVRLSQICRGRRLHRQVAVPRHSAFGSQLG